MTLPRTGHELWCLALKRGFRFRWKNEIVIERKLEIDINVNLDFCAGRWVTQHKSHSSHLLLSYIPAMQFEPYM